MQDERARKIIALSGTQRSWTAETGRLRVQRRYTRKSNARLTGTHAYYLLHVIYVPGRKWMESRQKLRPDCTGRWKSREDQVGRLASCPLPSLHHHQFPIYSNLSVLKPPNSYEQQSAPSPS